MRKIKNVDFFDFLFQLSIVERWSDFSPRFIDTTASHSYRVAAFAIIAGQYEKEYCKRKDIDMKVLLGKALFGKFKEAITGSLRHNAKKHPIVSELIAKMEYEASTTILHSLSNEMREPFGKLMVNAEDSSIEGQLVKDLHTFDSMIYASREVVSSNLQPFAAAYDDCRALLMNSPFESIHFLLESFEDKNADFNEFINAVLYMDRIKRWSGKLSFYPDNDATHMFRTSAMGYFLSEYENIKFNTENDTYLVVGKILLHDLIEYITSDFPSPIKKKTTELANAFERYENVVAEDLVECTPLFLRPIIEKVLLEPKDETKEGQLVDIVDKMDPLLKSLKEVHLHVDSYKETYEQQLYKLQSQYSDKHSVQYFLGMILPNLIFPYRETGN